MRDRLPKTRIGVIAVLLSVVGRNGMRWVFLLLLPLTFYTGGRGNIGIHFALVCKIGVLAWRWGSVWGVCLLHILTLFLK